MFITLSKVSQQDVNTRKKDKWEIQVVIEYSYIDEYAKNDKNRQIATFTHLKPYLQFSISSLHPMPIRPSSLAPIITLETICESFLISTQLYGREKIQNEKWHQKYITSLIVSFELNIYIIYNIFRKYFTSDWVNTK